MSPGMLCVTHTGLVHRAVDRQVLARLEREHEHGAELGRTMPVSAELCSQCWGYHAYQNRAQPCSQCQGVPCP